MKPDTSIVVASTRMDDYGNQFITATDNQEYKVGEKRSHLHGLAQPGVTLTLKWDNFKNKDYVADVQVGGGTPQPVAPVAPPAPVSPAASAPLNKDTQIALAVSLKAAVDNTPEGTSPEDVIAQATEFMGYLTSTSPKVQAAKPAESEALTSPKATPEARKALGKLAKDSGIETDWLVAAAVIHYKKEIKDITMMELSDLTGKLGAEIEKRKAAEDTEDPFA